MNQSRNVLRDMGYTHLEASEIGEGGCSASPPAGTKVSYSEVFLLRAKPDDWFGYSISYYLQDYYITRWKSYSRHLRTELQTTAQEGKK